MSIEIINKLEGLKFLAGSVDTADLFTDEYESMLKQFTGDKDTLRAMKRILGEQTAFMMNQYIKEKPKDEHSILPGSDQASHE